jgi:hypothetical protein
VPEQSARLVRIPPLDVVRAAAGQAESRHSRSGPWGPACRENLARGGHAPPQSSGRAGTIALCAFRRSTRSAPRPGGPRAGTLGRGPPGRPGRINGPGKRSGFDPRELAFLLRIGR